MAVAGALLWSRSRPAGAQPLDPNVIAVAPFDALDPALALWHEGLVDALSRSLDGAGPFRTVSPTTVIRRWRGRADRESAAQLGERTGAGLVLYGSIASAGRDSVRLRASLLDLTGGSILGEQDARGAADHVDQLADSIAVGTLRAVGRSRPTGAARLGGLGSRSLPALKAFLVGEQAFRRARWDSAGTAYSQALTLDSSFALAMRRLSVVRGWRVGVNDSLGEALAVEAGERNHGLPPRDSLLVVADSIMGTLDEGATPDSSGVARIQRLLTTAETATQRYPDDPEAWVALGEARQHFGAGLGVSEENTLAAFARAIALDSSFAPAYIHCVGLAFNLGDTAAAHRYARRFLALGPAPEDRIPVQVMDALLNQGLRHDGVARVLDTLSGEALVATWADLITARDSTEITVELARRFVNRPVNLGSWYSDSIVRLGLLGLVLAQRGHVREAVRVLSQREDFAQYPMFTELALAGLLPADSVSALFHTRLRREPFWPLGAMVLAPPWWLAQRDTAALRRYVELVDWRARSSTKPRDATDNPYWARAAKAYLRLARGDSSAAVREFQSLPPAVGIVFFERLTLARLLAAQGRDAEALGLLDRGFPWPRRALSQVFWQLERGRVAEKLGQTAKAAEAYRFVIDMWRRADPELRPYVDEARAGLGRLGGERA
jgi:serine/threonine-protein kinase